MLLRRSAPVGATRHLRLRQHHRIQLLQSSAASMSDCQVLAAGSAEPAPGPDRSRPLFLTTWSCPYAQRTWIALNAKGIDYTPVLVDLENKPEWFFKHNEYGRVPTLVWKEPSGDVKSLYESLICNEYVAELPGPALLPEDAVARAAARLLIDQFGAKFGSAYWNTLMAADAAAAAPACAELTTALRWLEAAAHPEGPFLLGKSFSLVDAAIIPQYIRLQVLERLGTYSVPTSELPRLTAWHAACLAHPAVQGSIRPPNPDQPYIEQLLDTYKSFIARRRAAAAP